MSKLISGQLFKNMIIEASYAIEENKILANELNVFPVPDGDTGTNMCLTVGNARKEMEKLPDDTTLSKAVDTAASALLRGARGNSGVILSLLFRGFSKKLREKQEANGALLAISLKEGVDAAYKAVMKPAEGTILTVSRVASQHVVELCQADSTISVDTIFNEYINKANEALKQTQFQNPVLEKAGVVDAGAFGYIKIIEGMRDGFNEIKRERTVLEVETATFSDISHEDITFTYCTEFIATRADKRRSISRMRDILNDLGDSIVVVEDDDIVKVHVHTDNPDKALFEGLKFGPLSAIKIENMREQHSTKVVHEAGEKIKTRTIADATKTYGFVSVSVGAGISDVFKDLGVDSMVEGGQTMNPSTEDILHAINSTPSEIVFVLPNNKNIIMAAEQASVLSTHKKVVVLPTKTIPQGISALLVYDPEESLEENIKLMTNATRTVRSGLVTYAARDSEFDGKKIKEGEILALYEGRLCAHSKKGVDAIKKLAKELLKKPSTFVTIIYGEEANEEHAEKVADLFRHEDENIEVTIINGGQPVYYFILSAE